MYRLGMNGFTFTTTQPPRQSIAEDDSYDIFKNGNFIAMEAPGRGGFEMRSNTGVRCLNGSACLPLQLNVACTELPVVQDAGHHDALRSLVWALPEVC